MLRALIVVGLLGILALAAYLLGTRPAQPLSGTMNNRGILLSLAPMLILAGLVFMSSGQQPLWLSWSVIFMGGLMAIVGLTKNTKR